MNDTKKSIIIQIIIISLTLLTLVFVNNNSNMIYQENNYENNLCEQYANLTHIEIKYINGDKYININNNLILENDIKKSCYN